MRRTPVVLGVAGSPRRFGNSDRLLEAALAGAREAGAEVRTLVAADAGLKHCLGCHACSIDAQSGGRATCHAQTLLAAQPGAGRNTGTPCGRIIPTARARGQRGAAQPE